jgi:hypothetical protein
MLIHQSEVRPSIQMNPIEQANKHKIWRQHISEFELSGLPQIQFCRLKNLVPHQFSYYHNLFKTQPSVSINADKLFAPVNINHVPASTTEQFIELTLPNGLQCKIPSSLETQIIQSFIGALLTC